MENYQAVTGKTYTLFGETDSTDQYYSAVRRLTDELLQQYSLDETQLLNYIKVFKNIKAGEGAIGHNVDYVCFRAELSSGSETSGEENQKSLKMDFLFIKKEFLRFLSSKKTFV